MVCLVVYIAFELCLGCSSDVVGYVYLLVVYFVACLLLLVCLGTLAFCLGCEFVCLWI